MDRAKEKQTRQFMMALLSDDQKEVVTQYEMFDWYLIFVRQSLGQPAIPILKNSDTGRYAFLEPDGSLNEDQELIVRQSFSYTLTLVG